MALTPPPPLKPPALKNDNEKKNISVNVEGDQKQGRSSSIGAKILSLVFRQLTEDFKEETLKKNLSNISAQL